MLNLAMPLEIQHPHIHNMYNDIIVFNDVIDTPIVKNQLGDSAGVFGACML